ncbi:MULTISPECIES: RNA polymerase sigma factor [Vagococcus]|uniref:RNA polymerase sigma factor n=1 Tax=Vagococcus TaxID=2737 RepID=UPI002FCB21A3
MKSDKWLIKKIVKKDSRLASEELVRRYYDELYYFLFRQIGKKEDTLDMTQEVFISALNSLGTYDETRASFKTWLFQIGTYKVIDLRRKRKIQLEELADYHWVEEDNYLEVIANQELLKEIGDYIQQFSPLSQEVFRLKLYGELSFKEIAILKDEEEEKIKAQYYRLLKKIRKEFTM